MTTASLDQSVTATTEVTASAADAPDGVVHTRFGMVPLTPEQQITFKGGLPGFPGVECYQLEKVPHVEGDLMLLQSVDHVDIAFFVLPLAKDTGVVQRKDIDTACSQLGIADQDLLMLTVVNLQRSGQELEKYVNLRAPICVDIQKQTGAQFVLNNPEYPLRLKLGS